jgi:opacity protein-like surface antigen
LTPYAGGGIGWYRFGETSAHSTAGDDVTETHAGYHLLAGAEVPVQNWVGAAFDAQWSSVPHAIGASTTSVAGVYNEHNLGGFTLTARIIIGR